MLRLWHLSSSHNRPSKTGAINHSSNSNDAGQQPGQIHPGHKPAADQSNTSLSSLLSWSTTSIHPRSLHHAAAARDAAAGCCASATPAAFSLQQHWHHPSKHIISAQHSSALLPTASSSLWHQRSSGPALSAHGAAAYSTEPSRSSGEASSSIANELTAAEPEPVGITDAASSSAAESGSTDASPSGQPRDAQAGTIWEAAADADPVALKEAFAAVEQAMQVCSQWFCRSVTS